MPLLGVCVIELCGVFSHLIITGWMDCIDVGFKCREGGVCENASG